MSGTRKLAAILAADVLGYSRLMGEDEAGTARAVREQREAAAPIVRGFGGRLVKTMGDGVLLEFPSVVAAVECAILMQKQMTERNAGVPDARCILYRIGVNLGDVLIDGEDILGDGVNIAARLEGIAEPGGVCISGSAYDHVRGRIDADFVDLGERTLKNIAQPVRVYALGVGEIVRASVSTPQRPAVPVKPTVPALFGIAALLIAIAAGGWYWFIVNRPVAVATGPPAPAASNATAPAATPTAAEQAKTVASEFPKTMGDQYSLVVLPFVNLSGDSSQDTFVDGISDSLTTDLSKIGGSYAPFSVIARNTAFAYKGKNVDVRQIGKDLGVRYALEGSVQRDQNRVRVNVQLVDAESGNHVWTERFDKPSADLFALQDEIVMQVGGQLKQELLKADIRRSQGASTPGAMDLYRQAMDIAIKSETRESWTRARDLCRRAVEIDPTNATLLTCAASLDFGLAFNYEPETFAERLPAIEADVNKALSIEPDNGEAHLALCGIKIASNRADEGVAECQRVLTVDPSDFAVVQSSIGTAKMYLGRAEETEALVKEGLRVNPSDIGVPSFYTTAGEAALLLGDAEKAVSWLRGAIERNANQPLAHFYLAAALARLGKPEEARAETRAGLALDPRFTIARASAYSESDNPTYLAQRERLFEAMRKAGVPEQ